MNSLRRVPNPDADGVWFHIDLHDPALAKQGAKECAR
jgi:hypothetical protein